MREMATIVEPKPIVHRADRPSSALGRGFRVVLVDEELPFPANSGKRIRTLNLMTRLARQHHLTLVCHRNADPTEAHQGAESRADKVIDSLLDNRTAQSKPHLPTL